MLGTSSCYAFSHLHHVVTHVSYVDPLICHEKSEGRCHLLKCMRGALCCPNAVFKKEIIFQPFVSVKCICAIRNSLCIHPFHS